MPLDISNTKKLVWIKGIHTVIWLFYNVVIFYWLYAAVANKFDKWIWICAGLVGLEAIVLAIFRMACPLTLIARKYSQSEKENFDIYLPNWLAKYNKSIYTAIVLIIVIVMIYRLT